VGLPIQVSQNAQALFDVAVGSRIGSGKDTKFWTDRWLQGKIFTEWAPNLFKSIPRRIAKRGTVKEALTNRSWVLDIKGASTVHVILDYLTIWGLVDNLVLDPAVPDQHIWHLWCNKISSLETDLEELGSHEVQVLHLACCKKSLLDRRPPHETWFASPSCLPSL